MLRLQEPTRMTTSLPPWFCLVVLSVNTATVYNIMLPETRKIFPFTYLPFLPSSAQNQRDIDNQDY
jgi:hypothetical protein